jgi:hypothetical protein
MKTFLVCLLTVALCVQSCTDSGGGNRNTPPSIPSIPSPPDFATNVSTNTGLSWMGGDPDGDQVTYSVIVGTDANFSTIYASALNLTNPSASFTNPLSYSTTYFWFVAATDGIDTAFSDAWRFTTIPPPIITLFSETFEVNSVPGGVWTASDFNSTSGLDYWGDQSTGNGARVHGGSWSAYCADNSDVSGQLYDNNMLAAMGPTNVINTSGYTNIQLKYWLYYDTEPGLDVFNVQYWNGSQYVIVTGSTKSGFGNWTEYTINFTGGTSLDVIFVFETDGSVVDEGAYVDDITVTGMPTSVNPATLGANEMYVELTNVSSRVGYAPPARIDRSNLLQKKKPAKK